MTPLQLELTKLIGKKEKTFGCLIKDKSRDEKSNLFRITLDVAGGCNLIISDEADDHCGYELIGAPEKRKFSDFEIIGNPATLPDFHRWMNEKYPGWFQKSNCMFYPESPIGIPYDSNKDFLDQDEDTLIQIRDLILSNQ